MAIEIERKFLVKRDSWRSSADVGQVCVQGYLTSEPDRTVRVRVMGDRAFLTVKGRSSGISRLEYEYSIPVKDAQSMLNLCPFCIEKRRHLVAVDGIVWEVDVFFGQNEGLVLAEIELDDEFQPFSLPEWIGEEVSNDRRYFNSNLSRNPFSLW